MDGAHAERGATPRTRYPWLFSHLVTSLTPSGTRTSVPVQIQAENKTHQFGFDGINVELLFDFLATTLGLHNTIAERRPGAVPKALFCQFPAWPA